MARFGNRDWDISPALNGGIRTIQDAQLAVLMDIRDELQTLNRLLSCDNFTAIPRNLERIQIATDAMRRHATRSHHRKG